MRRRDLLAGTVAVASTASTSWSVFAQSIPTMLRVGQASMQALNDGNPARLAFIARMGQLGYVEGRNFVYDFVTVANPDALSGGYASTVRRGADILLAAGSEAALQGARQAAGGRLPIVFFAMDFDPLRGGYVASLARPGGNMTGIFARQVELAEKRIQIAREVLPKAAKVALWSDYASREQADSAAAVAKALNLETLVIEFDGNPRDYDAALRRSESSSAEAVIVPASPVFFRERSEIARRALLRGVPLIAAFGEFVGAGALLSYGVDLTAAYRHAATYIDRIARGARPADLPIEQPTKFDLVVNLTTAKALGLTMPVPLLARADEVIE